MTELNRLLAEIRRDVDRVLCTTGASELTAVRLVENLRRLDAIVVESGCLPDEWEEPVVQRIEDEAEE